MERKVGCEHLSTFNSSPADCEHREFINIHMLCATLNEYSGQPGVGSRFAIGSSSQSIWDWELRRDTCTVARSARVGWVAGQ